MLRAQGTREGDRPIGPLLDSCLLCSHRAHLLATVPFSSLLLAFERWIATHAAMSDPTAASLASPDELLRQLEEFARGGNKAVTNSSSGSAAQANGSADTRGAAEQSAANVNGATSLQQAAQSYASVRPAARIPADESAAAGATGAAVAAKPRLSAAMQPPPSAVFPASGHAAAPAAAASKRSTRIRTSSFSQSSSEREAAAQAERMRQLVLQELHGPSSSSAAPSAIAAAPAPAPSGPKQRPMASYMAPTLSMANSTSAAMAAVAAAARAAAAEKEQRDIEVATAMRANPPRALLAKKKRPTDPASPPPATDPHPAPARRVVASYVDLQQMGAGSGALPLSLSQCSQCLVQVLRVMQASVVDAQAMAELFSILADYLPLSPAPAHANGSPASPSSAASSGVPSLESLIESLQRDQDVLGEAQMLNQAKLLSQLPRDQINHERMQRLYRWHLTHVQRKASAGTAAAPSSKGGSALHTPRAAAPAAASVSSATIPASASASGAATPSRAPPAIVDFSFTSTTSAQTPVPLSKPMSRPASGQRSPVAGAGATSAAATISAAPNDGTASAAPTPVAAAPAAPVSFAAATNAATLWAASSARDGTSSAGSHTASGGFSVSSFFSATARPSHPAAATPIPVRKGRYEDLPSRLLDHFKHQRGGMYSGGFGGAPVVAGRDRQRSSSRTRSRSRSSSRTRGGFDEELTPRRSPSPSPASSSGASTARAPIPNHALLQSSSTAGTPRSRSAASGSQSQDYWSIDPVNESALLRSTAKTPLRSSFTSAVSAAHAPSVMSTHSRGPLLSDSARAHPAPYVNKPSILPPSLSVGQFSAVQNKMQIPVRESYSRAQRPYPASSEDEEYTPQGSLDYEEYAGVAAAASGSDPSPDAFEGASPASDYTVDRSAEPPAHRGGTDNGDGSNGFDDSASPPTSGNDGGGDITLPENLNAMVAEIESMNSNLEELLAREAAQDYEQAQRTARILAQRRRTHQGSRASSLTRSGSRPRSSSRESIRDQTLRRPRTVFPGSAALYADDPEKLQELEAAASRRSRSRTRRGVDPAAPPHVYSPSPRRGHRPLSPNPHAYQAPARSSSGVRTAGPPPVPQQRDASYLPYETNLRHRQLSESLSATLEGLPSPTSRRRVAQTSPPRSPRSPRSARSHSSAASSRATTPRGSSGSINGGGALVPHRKLETVPQARHMGYLSPSANAELFRQSSTYATVIAGGTSGGSAQPPINYVRSRSPQRDRSIVDKLKYPQQRPMGYLAPEVNTRFVADARSWEKKIAGTYDPPIVGAPPVFKYDPATDPALKRPVARTITTQARPMGYLEPGVNAAYLRAAELQEARVAVGAPNGVGSAATQQTQTQARTPASATRAGSVPRKSAVGSNLAASMEAAASASEAASDNGDRDEPAHEGEPVVERTLLRATIAQPKQRPQRQHPQPQQQQQQSHQRESSNEARKRALDREWERDRLRSQQAEQDRLEAELEESEQRRLDAEMWDEQQQRREQEQQDAEEAAWAAEEAEAADADAPAPAAPASLDISPARSTVGADDRDADESSGVASPTTRRRMSEQAAARHAAQQAAFEETERQWSQQRTPGGSRKQPPSQQRSNAYHAHHDPMPPLRYDDDDAGGAYNGAGADLGGYDDAPHAASFMAAAAASAAEDDNGASSEADMYYKYLRTRSSGSAATSEPHTYASARDEYDPLAAEQATLAHAQPAVARRTPQTLRPSKRQP